MALQVKVWPRIDLMAGPAGAELSIIGEREVALATNGAPASKYFRMDAEVGGGTEYNISDGFEWKFKVSAEEADEHLEKELKAFKEKQAADKAAADKAAAEQAALIRASAEARAEEVEDQAGIAHHGKKGKKKH